MPTEGTRPRNPTNELQGKLLSRFAYYSFY